MTETIKSRTSRNILLLATLASIAVCCALSADPQSQPQPRLFGSSRQRPSRTQQQQQTPQATGTSAEVAHPANSPVASNLQVSNAQAQGVNRTARTAETFQNGDGYNIVVTNTCERDSMKVNIKTSRAFHGVIHTRGQRQKQSCTVEGSGDTEYNLEISHALNPQDPSYCGVIKARRESPEDKDTLSVVVAVRFHKSIELLDDKFFLLNCTNRCRRPDCSSSSGKLLAEEELTTPASGEREAAGNTGNQPADECTVWKFPWLITLLWCLGILLLASIISHCIMCSSMVCRCIKTEVEEREPSEYEGASDFEDSYNKRHPYQIEYDNKDIYKTSNNYAPYNLEEAQTKLRQKHRRSDR